MITGKRKVASTLAHRVGEEVTAYIVKYTMDDGVQEFEEEEIVPLIVVKDMPERQEIVESLIRAFDYLEDRLTGSCSASYSCVDMYKVQWCLPKRMHAHTHS